MVKRNYPASAMRYKPTSPSSLGIDKALGDILYKYGYAVDSDHGEMTIEDAQKKYVAEIKRLLREQGVPEKAKSIPGQKLTKKSHDEMKRRLT
jgi:hypothetical protein